MAGRCGCTGTGSGCSCLIVSSDTIAVTGTGSTGSPFTLEAIGGGGGSSGGLLFSADFRRMADGPVDPHTNGDGATEGDIYDVALFQPLQDATIADGLYAVVPGASPAPSTGLVVVSSHPTTAMRSHMNLAPVVKVDTFSVLDDHATADIEYANGIGESVGMLVEWYTDSVAKVKIKTPSEPDPLFEVTINPGDVPIAGLWSFDHDGAGRYTAYRNNVEIGSVTYTDVDPATLTTAGMFLGTDDATKDIWLPARWWAVTTAGCQLVTLGA